MLQPYSPSKSYKVVFKTVSPIDRVALKINTDLFIDKQIYLDSVDVFSDHPNSGLIITKSVSLGSWTTSAVNTTFYQTDSNNVLTYPDKKLLFENDNSQLGAHGSLVSESNYNTYLSAGESEEINFSNNDKTFLLSDSQLTKNADNYLIFKLDRGINGNQTFIGYSSGYVFWGFKLGVRII